MKFLQLYSLILESKLDDVIKKNKLSSDDESKVKELSKGIKQDKIAKYSEFLTRNKDVKDIVELINYYENNKFSKSINEITPEEIRIKMNEKKVEKLVESDIEKVYEDSDWLIISPNTYEASCKYGYGAKWCISMIDDDRHWNRYKKEFNKFYFVINKNPSMSMKKYAIQVEINGNITVWNNKDEVINYDEFELLAGREFDKNIFKPLELESISIEERLKSCVEGTFSKNQDGSYDVNGDIKINKALVKDRKLIIKFGKVTGSFNCSNNQLTSLEGCPKEVAGYFSCYNNQLTSLEGCPEKVTGSFNCSNNQLTSLEGCPKEVGGGFYCNNNKLTSLEGCPKEVGGGFNCYNNAKQFTKEEVKTKCKVIGGGIYV